MITISLQELNALFVLLERTPMSIPEKILVDIISQKAKAQIETQEVVKQPEPKQETDLTQEQPTDS